MKNMKSLFAMLLLAMLMTVWMTSCIPTCGCREPNAVNFDINADKDPKNDNDSCRYSSIAFYLLNKSLDTGRDSTLVLDSCRTIDSIDVFVRNELIGRLYEPVYDEAGLNCSAPGVVVYTLENAEEYDWYAKCYTTTCETAVETFNIVGLIQSKSEQYCQTIKIH